MRGRPAIFLSITLFVSLAAVSVWLPVDWALDVLELPRARRRSALAVVAIVIALLALLGLIHRRWLWSIVLMGLVAAVTVRLTYFGLVHFSGAGFTDEFFIHFELQSVQVAFKEYALLFLLAVAGVVVLLWSGLLAYRHRPQWSMWPAGLILMLAILVIAATRSVAPEWQLVMAWQAWSQPLVVEVDDERLKAFAALNLVETEVIPKRRVRATSAEQPKNLILLYLESVGVNLANRHDWPGLMPTFEQLLAEHAWVDHVWTSSYITIEGITNTQCGTLFPFGRGSDSLAEGDQLAEELPCLGDVLDRAGYYQVYMGGAGMGFAGKGRFLAEHGYDELLGLEHWREQGLRQRPGKWGLSDAELFDLSIEQIRRLREKDQPFNLTLLTIGTHIPGYLYRECEPYAYGDHRFLDALHCGDQLLGRWLHQLKAEGLLEDSVVVITADHHVFPNPDMRGLFGDDVLDRRLPFVVLGDNLPAPVQTRGAGYDLAPTVLDLLGVEHNARFILGRSLLREHSRPDYFLKRYAAVYDEHVIRPGTLPCEDQPLEYLSAPLTDCERAELIGIVNNTLASASRRPSQITCERTRASMSNVVSVPADGSEPLLILVGGESQVERFAFRGRPVAPASNGLYGLILSEQGEVLGRRFVSLDDPQDNVPEVWFDEPGGHEWVIVRHIGRRDLAVQPSIEVRNRSGQLVAQPILVSEQASSAKLDISARFCP